MPIGPYTKNNIGIRRLVYSLTPGQLRNFEPNGTQLYTVMTSKGYTHAGTAHIKGDTIPYDASGGTAYSSLARLERDFNARLIGPVD